MTEQQAPVYALRNALDLSAALALIAHLAQGGGGVGGTRYSEWCLTSARLEEREREDEGRQESKARRGTGGIPTSQADIDSDSEDECECEYECECECECG